MGKDYSYVAHCLDFNIFANGRNFEHAHTKLIKDLTAYLVDCNKNGRNPENKANLSYWQSISKCRHDHRFLEIKVNNTLYKIERYYRELS